MSLRLGLLTVLVTVGLLAEPSALRAGTADDTAAICERAIVAGAARGGVPTEMLHAIALTETGRMIGGRLRPWPWAINREGKGHWFETREEALAFAQASLEEGRRSFDVGCFQVNYHWHGHNFPSLEAMFDQEVNGTYAAQFLRSLQTELGDWTLAAGAYHSRTPHFASIYRERFARMLAGLGGTPLVVAAAAPPAEVAAEPAVPRRSVTRIAARAKVISLGGTPAREPATTARSEAAAAIRVERGTLPPAILARMQPVVTVSTRSMPR
jgi:hypothetical protein